MKSIIAVNNLGYIGLNNKLLWKSAQDMSHFIKMTINQRLVVGYNTAQDLPKLINRTIIIDIWDEVIEYKVNQRIYQSLSPPSFYRED